MANIRINTPNTKINEHYINNLFFEMKTKDKKQLNKIRSLSKEYNVSLTYILIRLALIKKAR